MTCQFPRNKFRHQREAAGHYLGAIEAKSEIALNLLKQGRIRECRRYLEESLSLRAWFDSLPLSEGELNSVSTPTPAGGLPAGDKE